MSITLAPSVLSADLGNLSQAIADVSAAGAPWIHLDVMDGSFVPNITFGPNVIRCLKKPEGAFFDAHLMIANPEKHIDAFVAAGVDLISVHAEATHHLHRVVQQIKSHGIQASVALNPATPLSVLDYVLPDLDMVLLMSVNPGWGGQSFIPAICQKVQDLHRKLEEAGRPIPIQVDGGVNTDTIAEIAAAGASNFVAGSAIFGKGSSEEEYRQQIQKLLSCLGK